MPESHRNKGKIRDVNDDKSRDGSSAVASGNVFEETRIRVNEIQSQLAASMSRLKRASMTLNVREFNSAMSEHKRNAPAEDDSLGDDIMRIVLDFVDEVGKKVKGGTKGGSSPEDEDVDTVEFITIKSYIRWKTGFLGRLIAAGEKSKRLIGFTSLAIADLWYRCAGQDKILRAADFLKRIPMHISGACEEDIGGDLLRHGFVGGELNWI